MSAPVTEAAVLAALRPIIDPDFGKSIVDLGFIKQLRIDGGRVAFTIELTTPACPVKAEFEKAARETRGRAARGRDGGRHDGSEHARPRRGGRVAPGRSPRPACATSIAVASGKGGVGKSTTGRATSPSPCARAARAWVSWTPTSTAPSLPLLTGVHGRPHSADKRIFPLEGHGLKLMSMGFFVTESLAGDLARAHGAVDSVCSRLFNLSNT
ncbi:MAG: iron-sulfur cluster assembly protein [Candidatus Moduliflexus flocculans]|nr:iron-sulfur cluster assembly protein [Candidatus Moduliflexus flocculans]